MAILDFEIWLGLACFWFTFFLKFWDFVTDSPLNFHVRVHIFECWSFIKFSIHKILSRCWNVSRWKSIANWIQQVASDDSSLSIYQVSEYQFGPIWKHPWTKCWYNISHHIGHFHPMPSTLPIICWISSSQCNQIWPPSQGRSVGWQSERPPSRGLGILAIPGNPGSRKNSSVSIYTIHMHILFFLYVYIYIYLYIWMRICIYIYT